MKKLLILSIVLCVFGAGLPMVQAATTSPTGGTVLPTSDSNNSISPGADETFCQAVGKMPAGQALGEKIRCGNMSFADIPFYLMGGLTLLMQLSTFVSVVMIMVGGYLWIVKDLVGEKNKALNMIKYSLIGLVVSSAAWMIVNVIQGLILGT